MKSPLPLTLSVFIVFLFVIDPICTQKSQPVYEDYEGVDLNDPGAQNPKIANENFSVEASPNNDNTEKSIEEVETETNQGRTKFSDERFARLFPSRAGKIGGRNEERRLMPKEVAKPKPTLPSFIKSTPALIRVQITTPSSRNLSNRQRSASTVTNRKASTTTTTARPSNGSNNINRNRSLNSRHQLNGRLSTTTNSPLRLNSSSLQSTTPSSSRRRYNSSGPRFQRNNNSTIPALNPRGRN